MSNKNWKNIAYAGDFGGTKSTIFEEKIPFNNLESKVRFSLKHCSTSNFCIRVLNNAEINSLYKRLGYFEELTWQQVGQIPHAKGFSIEAKESQNHKELMTTMPEFSTFLHFRVNGTDNPFRVFGARKDDLIYIAWFDKDGTRNH